MFLSSSLKLSDWKKHKKPKSARNHQPKHNNNVITVGNLYLRLSLCSITLQQFLPALFYSHLQLADVGLQLLSRVHVELHQVLVKMVHQAVFKQLLQTQTLQSNIKQNFLLFKEQNVRNVGKETIKMPLVCLLTLWNPVNLKHFYHWE